MFIAPSQPKPFAPLGAIYGDGYILRSSGAQASNNTKSYRHTAPPEQRQVAKYVIAVSTVSQHGERLSTGLKPGENETGC
jgi:hypothetical protein